jgi:hypothetical protein
VDNPRKPGDITVKSALKRAANIVVLTAQLYREMALSALTLLPGRN